MVESKISRNMHLAPNPMAMGHDVRGGDNGRLYYQVGPDYYRHAPRRQES
jgi:hypothetical protein